MSPFSMCDHQNDGRSHTVFKERPNPSLTALVLTSYRNIVGVARNVYLQSPQRKIGNLVRKMYF